MRDECTVYNYFLRNSFRSLYSEIMYWSVNVYSKLILHPFYRIIIILFQSLLHQYTCILTSHYWSPPHWNVQLWVGDPQMDTT